MNKPITDVREDDDKIEVEVEETEGVEIEVVDDVPNDKKPRRKPEEPAEIPEDNEEALEGYSEAVQKRIKKLTFEAREAQRQREAIEREREEAVKYARAVMEQNENLRKRVTQGESSFIEQTKAKLTSDIAIAKEKYRKAYEVGDTDGVLDATSALSELNAKLLQVNSYRPPAEQPAQQQAPQPKPRQQPQVPQLSPRQKAWLDKNSWYGQDSARTGFALGVHETLVKEGVDPDSETYYTRIDTELRKRFADAYTDEVEVDVAPTARKTAPVVAPAGRSAPTGAPTRIRLTATQASIAKRLGLTNEQYARQLLKDQTNGR